MNIPFILNPNRLYFVLASLKIAIALQILAKGPYMKLKYILAVASVMIRGHRDGWNVWSEARRNIEF